MRKTTSRVLWILVGVLLVITGIACFAHPAATLGSLAILLGIAMLFSGVVDLVIFATARDAMYGSGWFLLDGVLTILLSIFILFKRQPFPRTLRGMRHLGNLVPHCQAVITVQV